MLRGINRQDIFEDDGDYRQMTGFIRSLTERDYGVGSTDHFSALKIWMFENKFVSLPSHLKTIEPMEVHRELRMMCNTETSKSDH